MDGVVKWFNNKRGYRFITGKDGIDYFVHYTDISMKGFKKLIEGQAVTFDTVHDSKGAKAINVKIVEV